MITLIAASIASAAPQSAPAAPPTRHHPAMHSQAADGGKASHPMEGMKECCCCKGMAKKSEAPSDGSKTAEPDHGNH